MNQIERGSNFDSYPDLAFKVVEEYLKSKGYYMNLFERDSKSFRFQIWKDPNGLPLTMNEGLRDFVETMKTDCNIIQDDTNVKLEYLADGVVHVIVELDKSN